MYLMFHPRFSALKETQLHMYHRKKDHSRHLVRRRSVTWHFYASSCCEFSKDLRRRDPKEDVQLIVVFWGKGMSRMDLNIVVTRCQREVLDEATIRPLALLEQF